MDKKVALLRQDQELFHTNDLAVLWGITNKNTLYKTVSRYIKDGTLVPVHKGLYAVKPLDRIEPVRLAIAHLHSYAYLSTETVLDQAGVINQPPNAITLVSDVSRRFEIQGHEFRVRQLMDDYLYHDLGVEKRAGYFVAIPERAVADLFYYQPDYYLDSPQLLDWDEVERIRREVYRR